MGCANHPAVEAGLQPCWVCAQPYCSECVVEFQGRTICGPCKATAVSRLEAGSPDALGDPGEPAPWERRAELGTPAAFVATCKGASLEPQRFFSRMDRTRTTYDCLIFPAIVTLFAALSQAAVQFAMFGSLWFRQATPGDGPMALLAGGFGLIGVVILPVLAIVQMFIGAALVHVALVVMKKATVPYHQTLRGFCYSSAPNIIQVVPFVGMIVGSIWSLVTQIQMVRDRHRCTGGTAAIAVLWPIALGVCCVGIVGLVVLFGVAAASK